MAIIRIENSWETFSKPDDIRRFLKEHNVTYEYWPTPARIQPLIDAPTLSNADKETVKNAYADHLERLAHEEGFIQTDIVVLNPQTPKINELLRKFDKEHYHTDNEVRYIFGGVGVFGFVGKNDLRFTVEVVAGDFISIPAYIWHWFNLTDAKNIKALRFFQDMSGWVPYYRDSAEQPILALHKK